MHFLQLRSFWAQKTIGMVLRHPRFWGAFVRSPLSPFQYTTWGEILLMYLIFIGGLYALLPKLGEEQGWVTPLVIASLSALVVATAVVQWMMGGRTVPSVMVDGEDMLALVRCRKKTWTVAHQNAFRYTAAQRRHWKGLQSELKEQQMQKLGQQVLNQALKREFEFQTEDIPYSSTYSIKIKPR